MSEDRRQNRQLDPALQIRPHPPHSGGCRGVQTFKARRKINLICTGPWSRNPFVEDQPSGQCPSVQKIPRTIV